ncbi:hypothetical protein [Mycolicibacterium llatzerense]|uniref:hypothetical protein n=1 Tax=Mycolicibacterium llatzerense TaxID=280871 RepID=UPI0021B5C733|nr:hypothetical protein [Mycolicibacterium llatzerense]
MAKIFASVLRVIEQIGFDLHSSFVDHGRRGIAAICTELAGNSQKWTKSARRKTQLIGPPVNNMGLLLGQIRLSKEIADSSARWTWGNARR